MSALISAVAGFFLIGAILWPLEWRWPALAGQPRWRRDIKTDLTYWIFTPVVTQAIAETAMIVSVVFFAVAAGVAPTAESIQQFFDDPTRLVRGQPLWLQALEALLVGDLVGYWVHRAFHRRTLWKTHAVHHSSTQVDWLSAVRLHPVNDVLMRVPQALTVLLIGFAPTVLVAYVPFFAFYATFLHANLPWSFGPLRYVIASPAFHRWHHTSQREGRDRNFAGLFPFLDLLFGTFYLPEGRQPHAFGVEGENVPDGIGRQLLYPFRRAPRPTAPAIESSPHSPSMRD